MNATANAIETGTTQSEAALTEFDYTVLVDTSGSMGEPVKVGSDTTRWDATQETLMTFVRDAEKLDSDGIGLVLFGGAAIKAFNGVNSNTVRAALAESSPRGGTPLAEALTEALKLGEKSDKKRVIVVFTDGVPDAKQAAADVLVDIANNRPDIAKVVFIQVGDTASATAYLKALDDDLKGVNRDVVDAKTVHEVDAFPSTAALLLSALAD